MASDLFGDDLDNEPTDDFTSMVRESRGRSFSTATPVAPVAPAEPGFGKFAKVGLRGIARTPANIAAGVISAFQGQAGVEAPGQGDVFEEFARGVRAEELQEQQAVAAQFPESTAIQTLSRLPQQLGFSAPATIGGIGAGVLTAPTAAVTGGAGPFIAGGAVAGGLAFRSSSNEVMTTYIDALDEQSREVEGRGLTPEEVEAAKDSFSSKATEFGLWEALPEAVGGAIAGRLIFGPLKKIVGEKIAGTMLGKLGTAAAVVTEELSTETITQVGQSQTLEGTLLASEDTLDWTPESLLTALKEVAPDTLLLTAVMGGGTKLGSVAFRSRQESKLANNLGINKVELRERTKILLGLKQQNPDFDVASPDAQKFLAGSVILEEGKLVPRPERIVEQAELAPAEEVAEVEPEAEVPAVEPIEGQPVTPDRTQAIEGQPVPVPEPLPEEPALAPTTEFETPEAAQTFFDALPEGVTKRLTKVGDKFIVGTGTEGVQEVGTEREELNALVQKQINITPETEFTDRERQLQETHSRFITGRLAVEARRAEAAPPAEVAPDVAPDVAPELVLRANGAPFATEASALRSQTGKRLAETHDIVPVEGGVAFQLKAEVAPAVAAPAAPAEGVTQEVQAETVPVQEQQVFRANGKPFASEASALRSATGKRLAETHEIVQVEGGVAFQPKLGFRRGDDPIQDLHTGLSSYLRTSVPKGTFTQAPAPKGQEELYSNLENLLGKKIVFFKAKNSPMKFEGVTNISPDTIFVNVDSKTPHLVVTGHEFLHEYGRDSRPEYAEMKKTILGMIPKATLDAQVAKLTRAKSQEGQAPTRESVLREAEDEIVADYFGDQFTKMEFWKKVEARNPEGFTKFVQGFIDFIEKIKGQFSGPEVTDMQKAQDVAAEALASFVRRNPETAAAQADGTLTARRFDEVAKQVDSIAKEGLARLKSQIKTAPAGQRPRLLAVAPESMLVNEYKKIVPQLPKFSATREAQTALKTGLIDKAMVEVNAMEVEARKGVGESKVMTAMTQTTLYQVTPWKSIYEQDWVPKKMREEYDRADEAKKRAMQPAMLAAAKKTWNANLVSKNTGKTFAEGYAIAEQAYNDLKTDALKGHLRTLGARTASIRKTSFNEVARFVESITEEGSASRKRWMDAVEAQFTSIKGTYFPMSQKGDYVLEYTDSKGLLNKEYSETEADADAKWAAAQSMGGVKPARYKKNINAKGSTVIPQDFLIDARATVLASQMAGVDPNDDAAVADAEKATEVALDQINQVFLKWAPETSALKNSIHRKSILGFDESSMISGYVGYINKSASDIAYYRHGRELDNILREIDQGIVARKEAIRETGKADPDINAAVDVRNDVSNRIASIRNIQSGKVQSLLAKGASYWLLSSPRQLVVQMSQIPVLTFPSLATKYGVTNAGKVLTRSIGKAFSPKYSRSKVFDTSTTDGKKVDTVLSNIEAQVDLDNRKTARAKGKDLGESLYSKSELLAQIAKLTPYQKEMLALRYSMSIGILDISLAHEAGQLQRGEDPESTESKVAKGLMYSLKTSELASRKAAILGTFQMATEGTKNVKPKSFFDAMGDVQFTVKDTLFDFSTEAKGTFWHKPSAKVLGLFQTFNVQSTIKLVTLVRDTFKGESKEVQKQAAKELGLILGVTGALAGTTGLPLSGIIFAILGAMQDDDDLEDPEVKFDQAMKASLGEAGGRAVTEGLPAMFGTSISRSVGFGKFLWTDVNAPEYLHGNGLAAHVFAQLAGPAYATPAGFVKGWDEMERGNYMKGLEVSTPKPIRDVLKALRFAQEGVRDSGGRRIIEGDVSAADIILLAIGFTPKDIEEALSKEFAVKKLTGTASRRMKELATDVVGAYRNGEDATEATEAAMAFARRNPVFAKNMMSSISSTYRDIVMDDAGVEGKRAMAVKWAYFPEGPQGDK